MGQKRCEPSISFNTNSILLRWEVYNYPDGQGNMNTSYIQPSTYEGRQYVGSYSKSFLFKDYADAMKEALQIAKESGQVQDEYNDID